MQYIEYEYAKDNGLVGWSIHNWMKHTPHLSLKIRGYVIKDWREGKSLLQVGDKHPGSSVPHTIEEWYRSQANRKYHNKAYQSAYLKGYFKV